MIYRRGALAFLFSDTSKVLRGPRANRCARYAFRLIANHTRNEFDGGALCLEELFWWTIQIKARRTIKDSPDGAEVSKAEAARLGVQVKELFYTPGGPHDAAMIIEAEGPEPIHKFMSNIQSLGNVKMKFIRAFSIEEMRKMV